MNKEQSPLTFLLGPRPQGLQHCWQRAQCNSWVVLLLAACPTWLPGCRTPAPGPAWFRDCAAAGSKPSTIPGLPTVTSVNCVAPGPRGSHHQGSRAVPPHFSPAKLMFLSLIYGPSSNCLMYRHQVPLKPVKLKPVGFKLSPHVGHSKEECARHQITLSRARLWLKAENIFAWHLKLKRIGPRWTENSPDTSAWKAASLVAIHGTHISSFKYPQEKGEFT